MSNGDKEAGVEAPDDRQAVANLAEYALVRAALRSGFNIPQAMKTEALAQVREIMTSCPSQRTALIAVKLLLAMETHNLDVIETALRADKEGRLLGEPGEQRRDLIVRFS